MPNIELLEKSMPVAPIRIAALGCRELAEEVDRKLVKFRKELVERKQLSAIPREFDSWISEKSTCRSHKTCFFCVKFLVFIYCILLQCVVKYNKGGILHASYYIEI